MKKIQKIPPPPKVGDERVISYFTVMPITIIKDDVLEKRWMERVYIKQQYVCEFSPHNLGYEYYWKDIEFVDEQGTKEKTTQV